MKNAAPIKGGVSDFSRGAQAYWLITLALS